MHLMKRFLFLALFTREKKKGIIGIGYATCVSQVWRSLHTFSISVKVLSVCDFAS